MKIVKYTKAVQDLLKLKCDAQPSLHCGIIERTDGNCLAVIWIWDTRKVIGIEPTDMSYADFMHKRTALAPDNHMPLQGLPAAYKSINDVLGFNKYDAERMRAYLDKLKWPENAIASLKAVFRIYNLQDSKERELGTNLVWDGIGFGSHDIRPMKKIYDKLCKGIKPTDDEAWHAINCIKKYSRQLARLAGTANHDADHIEQWLRRAYAIK